MDALRLRSGSGAQAGLGPGSSALLTSPRPLGRRIACRVSPSSRNHAAGLATVAALPRGAAPTRAPRCVAAAATGGAAPRPVDQQPVFVEIPASQDDAVQQSADALGPALKPLLAGGSGAASPAKKAKKVRHPMI